MRNRIWLTVGACALAAATALSAGSPVAPNFTVKSTSVELPYDETFFPDGPGAEVMNNNCASCHSASMALLQPKLSREQWTEIVRKMRDVYHAPVADEDVPAIIDYLAQLSPS